MANTRGTYGRALIGGESRRPSSASKWILGGVIAVGAVIVWNHETKKTAKLYRELGKSPPTFGEDTRALAEDIGDEVKRLTGEAREKIRDWRSRKS